MEGIRPAERIGKESLGRVWGEAVGGRGVMAEAPKEGAGGETPTPDERGDWFYTWWRPSAPSFTLPRTRLDP